MSELSVSKGFDDYGDLLGESEHRWRRRLIALALLAALIGVGAYALWAMVLSGGGSATAEARTATVEKGSISTTVSTTGTVVAQSTTDLSFDQSGRVSAVYVTLGQEVKAGDVLAEIESTDLQDAVTTAEVNLSSAQTKLSQLLQGSTASELASADQSLIQAQANYDQAVRALEDLSDGPSDSERLSAEQAVVSAQANYDQAKLALSELTAGATDSERLSAEQAVLSAQAQLNQANSALSDLTAGPSDSEVLSAQQAVTSAQAQLDQAEASRAQLDSANDDAVAAAGAAVTKGQNALDNAERTAANAADSLSSAGLSLTAEEEAYCAVDATLATPTAPAFCTTVAQPVSSTDEAALLNIKATGTPAELATHAQSVLAASTSYKNALSTKASADAAVESAEADLEAAESDLSDISSGPSSNEIASADAAVTSAQQALDAANAKLAELYEGPTESELATAQANVDVATAALEAAKAKLAELDEPTQSDLEKAQDSVETAAVALEAAKAKLAELDEGATESEIAAAQDNVKTAAAALTVAQAKRDDVYAGSDAQDIALQSDQVRLAQLSVQRAQENLEETKLVAPFDGTVAELNIEVGEAVGGTGGDAAIVLNTPNAVRLELTITESDLPSVKAGQSGVATFDALEGSAFPIVIDSVGTNPTTTQGVVTYEVRASFVARQSAAAAGQSDVGATAQAGTAVAGATPSASAPQVAAETMSNPLPGMNATVTITVEQAQNVLMVPDGAIQSQGPNSVVEVRKDDGSTETVVVQTGLSDGTNTEITAGLEEGQTVIIPSRIATSTQTTTSTASQQGALPIMGGPPEGANPSGGAP
jgi:multidrug efflux pump subunit AcrA (membrane-fusion protein)